MPAWCAHLVCSYKIQSRTFPLNINSGENIRCSPLVINFCFRNIKMPSPKRFGRVDASTSPDRNYSAPKKLMWLKAFTVKVFHIHVSLPHAEYGVSVKLKSQWFPFVCQLEGFKYYKRRVMLVGWACRSEQLIEFLWRVHTTGFANKD